VGYQFESGEWKLNNGGRSFPLNEICSSRSKPFYLYDLDDAVLRASAFAKSGAQVHYAMKANSNFRLLKTFAGLGLGADVVSLGEMQLALKAGFAPAKIIFSGVAKDREDLEAALAQNILQINAESFEELKALESICQAQNRQVAVALRLNILLTAPTHKNIQTSTPDSKFGLDMRQLPEVLEWLKGGRKIQLKALTVHIGSQIMDAGVFELMAKEIGRLYREVKASGFPLERLDLGGGLGIDYQT
jgi:diaminopimelate decarboxylase